MKKRIGLVMLFMVFIFSVKSQGEYKSAVGVRGGFYKGISAKHFMSNKVAVEGLLTTRYNGINITGLLEFHNQAFNTERLNWYFGFGAHAGYYNSIYYSYYGTNSGYGKTFGVDGIIGIEYTLDFFPLNIGLDWKPIFNLYGGSYFRGDSGALSIRYCFNQ
ncbi:hypothetical protein DNU06_14855 [Putridiphycobacter roseus]|uniref:Outer membrane protein beta-barrel domain-containing protein n=1 Tax=Putridiphycobacter roseus TaxID=2219161 RepID=A0A2W1MXH4_9FLAO|nr:hypothetical protein [Putridiphycobacter roseus]PZE16074.1 hypothetical protein DNU06_14855 [Putridiphycobacter roseus]